MLFRDDQVVIKLLTLLNNGVQTNYVLNLMSLIDVSVWKTRHIK